MQAPLPPVIMLTAVSVFSRRASAHLQQRLGLETISLANPRRLIERRARLNCSPLQGNDIRVEVSPD
jgi:hypothetical protein